MNIVPGSEQGVPDHGVSGGGRVVHAAPKGEDVDGGHGHLLLVTNTARHGTPAQVRNHLQRPET